MGEMIKEIWRSIPNIADNYQVSNLGRVRNVRPPNSKTPTYLNGHSMSISGKPRAYCRLLTKSGEWKTFKYSYLVATAFISNPKGYKFVAHINGDLTDDRACNLHWAKSQSIGMRLARARKELIVKNTNSHDIYKYWICNNNDIGSTANHFKINYELVKNAIRTELSILRNKRNQAIINEFNKGKPQVEIAKKYKLDETTICRIIKGER